MGDTPEQHPTDAFLEEAIREAERVQDHSIASIEAFDNRTQNLITLASTGAAGGFLLGAFFLQSTCGFGRPIMVLAAAFGVLSSIAALVYFLQSYTGIVNRKGYVITPDPDDIVAKLDERKWSLRQHRIALIVALRDNTKETDDLMENSWRSRRIGIHLLIAMGAFYGVAATLFIGASLFGRTCAYVGA